MKSISKLKNQARAHEQNEDWPAAIQAYQKVLSALDDAETELDLGLYNRIGDLYYRVGQPDRAVHYYAQAAQKYAELGLFNNAIALCNKALRYRPDDPRLFRMLGEYSAEQGFLIEARRWYLKFAERQVRAGKVEEAFAALEDFAALADDPSVRETLAEQFLAHGRAEEALRQLERAYKERLERGEDVKAKALADRIREMDPSANLDALAEEVSVRGAEPDAADDLVIETSAGAAGFRGGNREAEKPTEVEEPSGLETRPDESLAAPEEGDAVSGLETGYGERTSPATPEPGGGLAGVETFDAPRGAAPPDADETAPPEAEVAGDAVAEAEDDVSLPRDWVIDTGDEPSTAEVEREDGGWVEDEPPAVAAQEEVPGKPLEEPVVREEEAAAEAEEVPGEPLEEPVVWEEEVAAEAEDVPGEPLEEPAVEAEGELPARAKEEPAAEPPFDVELPDVQWGQEAPEATPPSSLSPLDIGGVEAAFPAEEVQEAAESSEASEPEPASSPEPAASSPLLDLGDGVLLPDLGLAPLEVTDEEALASFDLEAFDLTLADATESATGPVARDVDVRAVLGRAREQVSRGLHVEALSELHLLLAPQLEPRVYHDALAVINEILRWEPDDFMALQRRVEFAAHLRDKGVLAAMYADLAAYMTRKGAEGKAAAVYRRVLELDPGNEAARSALGDGGETDAYVDLAAFLDEEGLATALASGEGRDQVADFAELFSEFKAKVTEDVAVEESGSHYDLGLAFKEMGLVDEAIAEFQTALRGGEERLKVYEELGKCFMLKEQYTVAVKILARALDLPREDPRELLGVYYNLGLCHEELGDRTAARQAYESIMVIDPSFSDVPERLSRL